MDKLQQHQQEAVLKNGSPETQPRKRKTCKQITITDSGVSITQSSPLTSQPAQPNKQTKKRSPFTNSPRSIISAKLLRFASICLFFVAVAIGLTTVVVSNQLQLGGLVASFVSPHRAAGSTTASATPKPKLKIYTTEELKQHGLAPFSFFSLYLIHLCIYIYLKSHCAFAYVPSSCR